MSQLFRIHPYDPQMRLINQAAAIMRKGGVIIYPTDSCYALGCQLGNKAAQEQIRLIRKVDQNHNFTLVCRDLSDVGIYARVDNQVYRLMRALTPGPYTFILPATREVPRRLQNPRRKTIGIRIPDHPVAQALLESMGEPIMSSTLLLAGDDIPINEPAEIQERLGKQVDAIIDSGSCGLEPTTVVAFDDHGVPQVLRVGRGATDMF
jgi:tRNA threonylcarbamoyl adenosine modification protein (Sua5/YciO/YrdC/YwlC family)